MKHYFRESFIVILCESRVTLCRCNGEACNIMLYNMNCTFTLTRTASLGQPNMFDVDIQAISCTRKRTFNNSGQLQIYQNAHLLEDVLMIPNEAPHFYG